MDIKKLPDIYNQATYNFTQKEGGAGGCSLKSGD